jgi:phage terminase Nu1 subunit (DNA packaging protein)
MTELENVDAVCTSQQLAEILSVTTRRIDRLCEDKILKPVRGGKFKGRRYRLTDAVQAYLRYREQWFSENSSSKNGEYEKARSRRMNALATLAEYETKLRTGELIERSQVLAVIDQGVTTTKDHLLALPNKLMHAVAGKTAAEANAIMRSGIRLCLHELARLDVSKLDRKSASRKNGSNHDHDRD